MYFLNSDLELPRFGDVLYSFKRFVFLKKKEENDGKISAKYDSVFVRLRVWVNIQFPAYPQITKAKQWKETIRHWQFSCIQMLKKFAM